MVVLACAFSQARLIGNRWYGEPGWSASFSGLLRRSWQAAACRRPEIARAETSDDLRHPCVRCRLPAARAIRRSAEVSPALHEGKAHRPSARSCYAPAVTPEPIPIRPSQTSGGPSRRCWRRSPTPICEFKRSDLKTVDPDEWGRLKVEYERQCYLDAEKAAREPPRPAAGVAPLARSNRSGTASRRVGMPGQRDKASITHGLGPAAPPTSRTTRARIPGTLCSSG